MHTRLTQTHTHPSTHNGDDLPPRRQPSPALTATVAATPHPYRNTLVCAASPPSVGNSIMVISQTRVPKVSDPQPITIAPAAIQCSRTNLFAKNKRGYFK